MRDAIREGLRRVLEEADEIDCPVFDADDLASLHTDLEPLYPRKPSRTTMKRTWRERCR